MKIELSEQASTSVCSKVPDGHKMLRRSVRQLASEHGDTSNSRDASTASATCAPDPSASPYSTLLAKGKRVIHCEYLERRKIVYEAYEKNITLMRH